MTFLLGLTIGTLWGWHDGSGIRHPESTEMAITVIGSHSSFEERNDGGWTSIDVFHGMLDESRDATTRSYSQLKQDKIIMSLFRNSRNGFFLDLASNDARKLSNTYALERQLDWRGICIEPNARYWFDYTRYRTCKLVAAVVGHERMEKIDFSYSRGEFGGIIKHGMDNENYTEASSAYTIPLSEILERYNAPREIDYLSLDIEGAETYVMKSFPFSRYRIKVMTVERPDEELRRLFQSHGFVLMATISKFGETIWIHTNALKTLNLDAVEPEFLVSLILGRRKT